MSLENNYKALKFVELDNIRFILEKFKIINVQEIVLLYLKMESYIKDKCFKTKDMEKGSIMILI